MQLTTYTKLSTFTDKNAFQLDAYRPLVDRMLESASRGGGGCSRGVSAPGGVCSQGGGIPACTEADPLPPVNRMNDRQV